MESYSWVWGSVYIPCDQLLTDLNFSCLFPALSNILIFHYKLAWILIQQPLHLIKPLSVGELHVNWCSLTIMCFCCSSPFSPKWIRQSTRSQGLWDAKSPGSQGVTNFNDLLGTNKSAISSPSAIWENSEIPKSLLPHFTMEPFLFKWSLKLEL